MERGVVWATHGRVLASLAGGPGARYRIKRDCVEPPPAVDSEPEVGRTGVALQEEPEVGAFCVVRPKGCVAG